jgi:hypothetical protein
MDQLNTRARTIPRLLAVACGLGVAATMAMPVAVASAAEQEHSEVRAPKAVGSECGELSVTSDDDMTVVVDPETGQIVARKARREDSMLSVSLANALSRSTDGLRVFELSNGGGGIHLDGRFQHALVVRMRADGTFETVCLDHVHEAEAFLKRGSGRVDTQARDK